MRHNHSRGFECCYSYNNKKDNINFRRYRTSLILSIFYQLLSNDNCMY